ncbi:hypothetical protein JXQ70_01980 [bacterium]|nr:hypothetical protein [bacterium]
MKQTEQVALQESPDIEQQYLHQKFTLSSSEYNNFKDLLLERIGLFFPAEKKKTLERGLSLCLAQMNLNNVTQLYDLLLQQPEESPAWEKVINSLTVNETYFFRSLYHFQALKNHILKELIKKRTSDTKTLRIWSAGCSTGEEPYSIAILLWELIPDLDNWNIQILATDIDKPSLTKASKGIYQEWSFRNLEFRAISQYFKKTGSYYQLHKNIKELVTFRYLNLMRDIYPSMYNNTNMMDIILCRNVTIYFHEDSIAKVMRHFYQSLLPGGWLIVGESDPTPSKFDNFQCSAFEGTFVYRRPNIDEFITHKEGLLTHFDLNTLPSTTRPYFPVEGPKRFVSHDRSKSSNRRFTCVKTTIFPQAETQQPDQVQPVNRFALKIQKAVKWANQGQLEQAESLCLEVLKEDKLIHEAYYVLGMISMERNQLNDTESNLKKAIFLNADFIMAHFGLFTYYLVTENSKKARKYFENTKSLLQNLTPDEIVPHSEGISVRRFLLNLTLNQSLYLNSNTFKQTGF